MNILIHLWFMMHVLFESIFVRNEYHYIYIHQFIDIGSHDISIFKKRQDLNLNLLGLDQVQNGTALPTSKYAKHRTQEHYLDLMMTILSNKPQCTGFFSLPTGRTGDWLSSQAQEKSVVSNILSFDFGIPHQRKKAQACWPCLFHLALMHCSVVGNTVRVCLLFCHQFQ